MKAATSPIQLWHGRDVVEAAAAYGRAVAAKISELRARVLGSVASWKDCWATQGKLAEFHHCSVRTVQRALHDGRENGLIGCAFSKPGERPPGADGPMNFKWSHRWTIGRGLAGRRLHEAINKARAAAVICRVIPKRTFNEPKAIAKAPRTKLRNPPSHLTREQAARWIEEQMENEPATLELDKREPKPPD